MLAEIKQAIRRLKGVVSVSQTVDTPNATTRRAMYEIESGQSVACEDFTEYLKLVNGDLPD